MELINNAREYVYITTPYLILDEEMKNALVFAAKKGVDVRIITPHIPDKWYVNMIAWNNYPKLIGSGVKVYEYTPLQVKQAVVGYGRAEKKQVMDMVKRICNLPAPPRPDDAADAVALAICHARSHSSMLFKGDQEECSTI